MFIFIDTLADMVCTEEMLILYVTLSLKMIWPQVSKYVFQEINRIGIIKRLRHICI